MGYPRRLGGDEHHLCQMAFDYGYLGSSNEQDDQAAEAAGHSPLLVMRDGFIKGIYPYLLEAKGVDHVGIDFRK